MILTKNGKAEVVINPMTGKIYHRELTEVEKRLIADKAEEERMNTLFIHYCRVVRDHTAVQNTDAQKAIDELEGDGFTLLEILECALRFKQ